MSLIRCIFAWALVPKAAEAGHAHTHTCTEIVYSDRSEGNLWQGGVVYPFGDRSVFVYQPGDEHWADVKKSDEHICIGVVGCGADTLKPGVWTANDVLVARFREIREVLRKEPSLQPVRLDLLAGLVACDLAALLPNHPRKETAKGPRSRVRQARDYIDSSLHEHLTLSDLAQRVYVSPDYLRQLFREEFGESITRYIIRRRIELAADLLRSTDEPIKVIAEQAGFSSEYYFSRMFRKVKGAPPAAWRKMRHA